MSNIVAQELFTMSHDWTDKGNVQIPNGMSYVEGVGSNPNGSEWDLGAPEAIHLDELLLPPREHYLLNEVGTCYHAFSNSAHRFKLYWPAMRLDAGKYKVDIELWGDYVGVGTDKPPVEDPEHSLVMVSFGEHNKSGRHISRNGADNVSHISMLESGTYDIGFEVFVQWPQSSDAWANGMFIKSFTLTKLSDDQYTVRVVKVAQEAEQDILERIGGHVFDNRRTFTFSTDDCVHLMQSQLANERSYVEIVDADLPSQQEAIATFEALGIKWVRLVL